MQNRFFKTARRTYLTPAAILRGYNAVTALIVLKNYLDDPKASATEYFFDIAVHLLQAAISPGSSTVCLSASVLANMARITNIYNHALAGDSTIPAVANAIDLVNHGVNLIGTTALFFTSNKNGEPRPDLGENSSADSQLKMGKTY